MSLKIEKEGLLVPIEALEEMKWKEGQEIEIEIVGDSLFLKKKSLGYELEEEKIY